ncbi:hypothetical protein [Bacillus alkalicellulosilyticus]|uniref:hypothetical protein n=1 Tax=Alkalihalobacterium alkalicellulosilyticum TaxID=1912214 RepID=UPI000996715D|nr:hypothetical protein [Bacillus alkalicellulosilyticus]
MKDDILRTKELYKQLITILGEKIDNETVFIIKQLEMGLELIDEYMDNQHTESAAEQIHQQLCEIYINITRPRVGLSDYFIWKDDYEKRMEANERLDSIKDNLNTLFKC